MFISLGEIFIIVVVALLVLQPNDTIIVMQKITLLSKDIRLKINEIKDWWINK